MTAADLVLVEPIDAGGALLLPALPAGDQHPAAVYLASLGSEKSRASQRSALAFVAREIGGADATIASFPWASLRYQHLQALRSKLAERYAPASANRMLCAVRGVLREAMRLEQMAPDDWARASAVRGVRGSREAAGRALEPAEIEALFKACDVATWTGARDAALLALLYGAGLRRAEAVSLDVDQLDPTSGQLRVIGKGNKERITYAPPGSLRALRRWLEKRGAEAGPLLWGIYKGNKPRRGKRLSDRAVADVLERLAERAGVAPFTTHDMRRTMISALLDLGADLVTVQKMAGHAKVETTAKYDRRGDRAKVRTAELLRVPFDG